MDWTKGLHFFWAFWSDSAKLMDLHDRFWEANATPNTSGAAPWLEGRGSRPSYPLTLAGPSPRGWPIARQTIRVNFGGRTPKRSTPRKFWINRRPPVGLVVPVVDHEQCHPLIDLRLAIEADVLLVGLLLLSGCGSREEELQTACKPIPSRRTSEVVSTVSSPSRSEPTGIAPP